MRDDQRRSTTFRLPTELLDGLHAASDEHGLPVNYLVTKAIEEFLVHLIPPDELRLTHPRTPPEGR